MQKKSYFKCRKTELYRNCKNCISLNGTCDYKQVIEHKNRYVCPICLYKCDNSEKCDSCTEIRK